MPVEARGFGSTQSTGSCELCDLGAVTQLQVLCKSSVHLVRSQSLSHISRLVSSSLHHSPPKCGTMTDSLLFNPKLLVKPLKIGL